MKLSFVIPTYNEAGNVKRLIKEIKKTCKKKYECEIIIVDDNSPDGTAKIAKKEGAKVLLRKNKRGLGSAYKDGFKKIKKADVIFMMDADLSHNPKDIPRFVKELKNYDVVQGSRKIKGGKIKSWSIWRYLVSYVSSLITLPLTGLKDPNGSYKCFKKSVLKKINLENTSNGYGFLIELIYLMRKNHLKIKEIPIRFDKRLSGKSKLTFKEIFNNFKIYVKLYFKFLFNKD